MSPQEAAYLKSLQKPSTAHGAKVIPFPGNIRSHKMGFFGRFVSGFISIVARPFRAFQNHLETQAQSDRRLIQEMDDTGNNPFCIR